MPREPQIEQEQAFLSRNGGDSPHGAAPSPEPLGAGRMQDSLAALSDKLEAAVPEGVEETPEAAGSLAKFLTARKARRRSGRGRKTGSLSERLKNLSAESPDS
jgi:hypothetical protein